MTPRTTPQSQEPTEDWRTEAIRSAGGCGALSHDKQWGCIKQPGHDGPHGFEAPMTGPRTTRRGVTMSG